MDTPVMLLFFNRPDALRQSFAWVQRVKPKRLFLVQDGARANNEQDAEKVLECRKIVGQIDWDCEVQRNYSDINLSCDEREFTGIDWCFQFVDRLIILEDDCVPADSFYEFCGELLERYENDSRINAISGFVRCEKVEHAEYDYVFSHTLAGWGWATWKRAWLEAREIYEMSDEEYKNAICKYKSTIETYCASYKNYAEKALDYRKREAEAGKVIAWENLWGLSMIFHNQLAISPRVNMVQYVGITANATHSPESIQYIPRAIRRMFTQPAHDISLPINHPPYIVRDLEYEKKDYDTYFGKSQFLLRAEALLLKLCKGKVKLRK